MKSDFSFINVSLLIRKGKTFVLIYRMLLKLDSCDNCDILKDCLMNMVQGGDRNITDKRFFSG